MTKPKAPFWISPSSTSVVKGQLYHNWTVAASRETRKRAAVKVSIPEADLYRFNAGARQTYIATQLKEAIKRLGVLHNVVVAAKLAALKGDLPEKPIPKLVTATR